MSEVKRQEEARVAQLPMVSGSGLRLGSYLVPWWVVAVVVLLVLYVAYDQGYLEKWIGRPESRKASVSLSQSGPGSSVLGGPGLETPEQVRKLFRY